MHNGPFQKPLFLQLVDFYFCVMTNIWPIPTGDCKALIYITQPKNVICICWQHMYETKSNLLFITLRAFRLDCIEEESKEMLQIFFLVYQAFSNCLTKRFICEEPTQSPCILYTLHYRLMIFDVLLCKLHFNVVAGRGKAGVKYCCKVESIKMHHIL